MFLASKDREHGREGEAMEVFTAAARVSALEEELRRARMVADTVGTVGNGAGGAGPGHWRGSAAQEFAGAAGRARAELSSALAAAAQAREALAWLARQVQAATTWGDTGSACVVGGVPLDAGYVAAAGAVQAEASWR